MLKNRTGGNIFEKIRMDLKEFSYERGLRGKIWAIFFSPGFSAVFLYRIQDYLYSKRLITAAYMVYRFNLNQFGADILPGARIGGAFKLEHPVGIVIGAGVSIGDNCIMQQGVTLGARRIKAHTGNQYPTLGNNIEIGAKASVLGPIKIGDSSVIGAHALVLKSFPNNSVLIGVPAINLKK
jgi:serine O-acetyltransferase